MESPAIPINEVERLEALYRYELLNTFPEKAYDDIISIAASICDVPISLISLIDEKRCWFKAKIGLEQQEAPRQTAYAAHAINQPSQIMVVEDTLADERFSDSPLVLQKPPMRFYTGIPLITPDGFAIGTLCVIDKVPRKLKESQINTLKILAAQIVSLFELRLKKKEVTQLRSQLQYANQELESFSYSIAHELRAPLMNIQGFRNLIEEEYKQHFDDLGKEVLHELETSSNKIDTTIESIWNLSKIGFVDLQKHPINLSDLCDNVLARIAPESKYSFLIKENMETNGDTAFITIVLENLINNAIKYSCQREQPQIIIDQKTQNGRTIFFIKDNGVGFTEQSATTIFRPFHRLRTMEKFEGMGIGLSIVKKIINRHGGEVWAVGIPNEGATFYFTLS